MLDGTTASPDLLGHLARQHTVRCIARLAEILNGDDPAAAVAAAHELLSRGYGQALQSLAFDTSGIAIEVNAAGEADHTHRSNGDRRASWNAG